MHRLRASVRNPRTLEGVVSTRLALNALWCEVFCGQDKHARAKIGETLCMTAFNNEVSFSVQ